MGASPSAAVHAAENGRLASPRVKVDAPFKIVDVKRCHQEHSHDMMRQFATVAGCTAGASFNEKEQKGVKSKE